MTRRTLGLVPTLFVALALAAPAAARAGVGASDLSADRAVPVSVMNAPRPTSSVPRAPRRPTLEAKIQAQIEALASGSDVDEIPLRADLARAIGEREIGLSPYAAPEPALLLVPLTNGHF